jgi:hypothetical protein
MTGSRTALFARLMPRGLILVDLLHRSGGDTPARDADLVYCPAPANPGEPGVAAMSLGLACVGLTLATRQLAGEAGCGTSLSWGAGPGKSGEGQVRAGDITPTLPEFDSSPPEVGTKLERRI